MYESFALATARLAEQGKPLQLGFVRRAGRQRLEFVGFGDKLVPVDERGTILAPFRGHVSSFPYIAATRVLHGEVPPGALKDAIVLGFAHRGELRILTRGGCAEREARDIDPNHLNGPNCDERAAPTVLSVRARGDDPGRHRRAAVRIPSPQAPDPA